MRSTDVLIILAAAAMACCACPVMAPAGTRLVHCGTQSCLLVTGHRDNPASTVLINGHVVSVEGSRRWHMRIPVETLRAWSPPLARKIAITTIDTQS